MGQHGREWLGRLAAACLFLSGPARRVAALPSDRLERLAWPVMLLSAAWGILLTTLWDVMFALSWQVLYNAVAASAACAAAMTVGPYRRSWLALVHCLGRRPEPPMKSAEQQQQRVRGTLSCTLSCTLFCTLRRTLRRVWRGVRSAVAAAPATGAISLLLRVLALGAIALALALVLNHAIRWHDPDWPRQLSPRLAWLWPRAILRVLLLAPVWGGWSMLAAAQFFRPNERTDIPSRHFIRGVRPLAAALALAIPLGAGMVYTQYLYTPLRFVPPVAAATAALAGGWLLVRLQGGPSRRTLLATNVLTQAAFLIAYMLVR